MYILVCSPSYPTSKTIDFVFVDQLCRALARKGVSVTVIAPQTLTKCLLRRIPVAKNCEKIYVEDNNFFTVFRPKYFSVGNVGGFLKHHNENAFNRAVKRAFNRSRCEFNACYGHFWQSVKALYPLAKAHNIPLFASSGEETVNQARIEYTDDEIKNIGNYVNGVVSVSSNNKNECVATGLGCEEKYRVIPNAINNELFFPRDKKAARIKLGLNEDDFVVAFVGQFDARKGTLRVDEALKKLNDSKIKAIFVGQGPENPTYEGIVLKGRIPHDDLPELLSASDVFVLPTRQEGCCNATIEALACGLPIISSNLPFNYDVLNENNSLLIDQESIDAIVNSIRFLKENADIRKEMSHQALETARHLTLDERADKILAFINESLK